RNWPPAETQLQVRPHLDSDPELEKLLTAKQFARLKGIYLQMHGSRALADSDVQAALAIDPQQREKIEAALKEHVRQYNAMFAKPGQLADGLSVVEFSKKVSELTDDRDKKIDEILTAEQKAKLAEMKGKPFEMNASPPTAARAGFPDRLIPRGAAKIEFRLAERQAGEGLQAVPLERSNGTQTLVYLHADPVVTGEDIAKAGLAEGPMTDDRGYLVEITFTEEGAKKMAKLSEENAEKQRVLAILVDGKIVSARTLRDKI